MLLGRDQVGEGLSGFIGFIGFIGLIGLIGFIGFIGFLRFTGFRVRVLGSRVLGFRVYIG